jgi:hypothetical protein
LESKWRQQAADFGLDSVAVAAPSGPSTYAARWAGHTNLFLTDALGKASLFAAVLQHPSLLEPDNFAWFFAVKPTPGKNFPYGFSVEADG